MRNCDRGRIELPDRGPKGPLPIRPWGALGVPEGSGPHPLVVVVHGRHGDCPSIPAADSFQWPCFGLLLAPVHEGVPLPDLETAIVASRCDAYVPGQARKYLAGARHRRRAGRILSRLGRDDGRFAAATRCGPRDRLKPAPQQRWTDGFAAAPDRDG